MADLAAGTTIDDRYRVLSRLGSGGMADVFLAEDQQLGRKVALKLLHRRFSEDADFVERFRREAQAAAGLQHPNIVSVYDRGAFDGTYYIAMEYLPGRSLKQLVRQEAPLAPLRAIDIAIQILKAARFAHRHGIIHRDLKPHNVIVDDTGHVKVTDFGIARAGASDMTETGSIMGTAQYLSPEQAQGHAVSPSSDLYSVGVVLYELLTGHVPFEAESAVTIALKHVSEAPAPPTQVNPAIPPELEQVVLWSLNKNPVHRPSSADEFIQALEGARSALQAGSASERTASMAALVGLPVGPAGGTSAAAPHVSAVADAPPPVQPAAIDAGNGGVAVGAAEAPPPAYGQEDGGRRNPWPWVALVAVLLLAAGGAAAYLLTRPTLVKVPPVVGEQVNTARTVLQGRGFRVGVLNVPNAKPAGVVIGENPAGEAQADQGSTVTLTVSQGPGTATVPAVEGDTVTQAERAIRAANLKVGRVFHQPSNVYPAAQVAATNPAAGQTPLAGTAVDIVVSSGPAKVSVPDVSGESEGQAKSDLHRAGFQVNVTNQTTTSAPAGRVTSQSPKGGTLLTPGSTVTIVVSQAPATATVPSVTGQTAAAASSALSAAGFKVTQVTKTVSNKHKDGIVLRQTPTGGSTASKGSTVTIVVGSYTAPNNTTTSTATTTPTSNTT